MRILILGGGGMVGRKLADRLARDGHLGGRAIDHLTLHDVVEASLPAGAAFPVEAQTSDISQAGEAGRAGRGATGRDLPSGGHRVGRGGGRSREGVQDQPRRNAPPPRRHPRRRRRLPAPARLHILHRGLRGALSGRHRRRVHPDAAHELRDAEGHRRIAARRLHPSRLRRRRRHPPADHLRAPGPAEQGGVGLLLQHHPRTAGRPGSRPAGAGRRAPRSCLAPVRREFPRSTRQPSTATPSAPGETSPCRPCRSRWPSRSRPCAGSPGSGSWPASGESPIPRS